MWSCAIAIKNTCRSGSCSNSNVVQMWYKSNEPVQCSLYVKKTNKFDQFFLHFPMAAETARLCVFLLHAGSNSGQFGSA